ncbi:MAG: hypothetical protein AB8B48_20375, partial [Pseudomonadales bacterium]
MTLNIPPRHTEPFVGGIIHPALYLWDAWSYQEANEFHLYSLAVGRFDADGQALDPLLRNSKPFHVRHFLSRDGGHSWTDEGS